MKRRDLRRKVMDKNYGIFFGAMHALPVSAQYDGRGKVKIRENKNGI
jgi:hypothetical protein